MANFCFIKPEQLDCEWGCYGETYHSDCPVHNPIDLVEHSRIEAEQEPIRAELRIRNTSEAIRNRVLAWSAGEPLARGWY